jgi:purine-cytosine permease-like protein
MKKKFIDFMGFKDQDILEIKTGLSIILKNVFFTLKIGIPVILFFFIGTYFGFLNYFMFIFLIFVALVIGVLIIVSLSQTLGHDYLAEKEIVYFENADGTKGSFLKYKNEVK